MWPSHPARGAWIETELLTKITYSHVSHPARGAWIETDGHVLDFDVKERRTPPGVRGLKPHGVDETKLNQMSHPARGAWIETQGDTISFDAKESHPARGAWIETA